MVTGSGLGEDLRFPIGNFEKGIEVTGEILAQAISDIIALPENLKNAVANLLDAQLDTEYRPDGWTIRQVVHHVPESHSHAYIRFKWALTEDKPTIKPYFEERWAELPDNKMPVENSLKMTEALHFRWAELLSKLTDEDFERVLIHPETGEWKLKEIAALYAWHGKHHVAHITALRERNGW